MLIAEDAHVNLHHAIAPIYNGCVYLAGVGRIDELDDLSFAEKGVAAAREAAGNSQTPTLGLDWALRW